MRAAILLAAGRSRRFGPANKLMAPLNGRPLVLHALAAARAAPAGRVIVVAGAQAHRVAAAVRRAGGRISVVRACDHREGIAASLRAGFAALRPIERTVFIFLGDMPAVPHRIASRLALHMARGRAAAVRPAWRRRPGHPVLLRKPAPARIAALRGDRGLGAIDEGLVYLPVRERGVVRDIDRPGELGLSGGVGKRRPRPTG